MIDLLLLSPAVLLGAGVWAAIVVHRRTQSILLSSTAFTLFFSFGLAIDRGAVPVPTLLLAALMIYDVIFTPNDCIQTVSDGCYYERDMVNTFFLFQVCLWVQWAFWAAVLSAGHWLLFAHKISATHGREESLGQDRDGAMGGRSDTQR